MAPCRRERLRAATAAATAAAGGAIGRRGDGPACCQRGSNDVEVEAEAAARVVAVGAGAGAGLLLLLLLLLLLALLALLRLLLLLALYPIRHNGARCRRVAPGAPQHRAPLGSRCVGVPALSIGVGGAA